ncbi:MAG: hypothetical protein R3231_08375 [bacterium]|nr:hypothetical protein [bacterium]
METKSPKMGLATAAVLTALLLSTPDRAFGADIPSLVHYSEIILFGKTVSVSCQWAQDAPCILSHAKFRVENSLRGNYRPGDVITIESQGGEINGMKQHVPNAASFQQGEYALVFLNSESSGHLSVPYGMEGVIPCYKNGKKVTTRSGKSLERVMGEVTAAMGE